MSKIKKPKAPKPAKAPKTSKGSKGSKSVEVNVRLPITKVSIMSVILIGLLTLIGYSGYLAVNSIWKFTHPQFNISLDAFRSLEYIAKNISIPPLPGPTFINGEGPEDSAKVNYLQAINEYETEFRTQFPQSKLLNISDNELLNIGWSICKAKDAAVAESGEYSRADIVSTVQAKFVLRYPNIEGLGIYLDAVAQRALDQLCGGN